MLVMMQYNTTVWKYLLPPEAGGSKVLRNSGNDAVKYQSFEELVASIITLKLEATISLETLVVM
jgi:hypothetical protein